MMQHKKDESRFWKETSGKTKVYVNNSGCYDGFYEHTPSWKIWCNVIEIQSKKHDMPLSVTTSFFNGVFKIILNGKIICLCKIDDDDTYKSKDLNTFADLLKSYITTKNPLSFMLLYKFCLNSLNNNSEILLNIERGRGKIPQLSQLIPSVVIQKSQDVLDTLMKKLNKRHKWYKK